MFHLVKEAREICGSIRDRRLKEQQIADTARENPVLPRLIEFLLYLKMDMRLYVVSTQTHIEDIWSTVRDDEVILDFVMASTSELRLAFEEVVEHPNNNWGTLVSAIAAAYGKVSNQPGAMDEDTHQRLPDSDSLCQGLKENPWLVTLYLLEHIDLPIETGEIMKEKKGR